MISHRRLLAGLTSFLPLLFSPLVSAADTHSYAEPDKVRVTALDLDLDVAMDKHVLSGHADLSLDWQDKAARDLVLDTRDLAIEKVEALDAKGATTPLKFELKPANAILGSALHIALVAQPAKVRISYHTSPDASGLQWLDALQTAGKKHPFLFSQSEAIHARSWVPLQDTPAVRFTYTAHIRTPKELRAAMSADNDINHALDGDFKFSMPQRIPSYLLALSVGDMAVQATGPRSAIFADPGVVKAAATEFSDTEKMIATAEKLFGAYRWGRYDILVLPPSFPFGGMENPRLTFATPTVLAGDKSLVSLVAHELAHSWSGNLVTNASWDNIWLNEGFTTYVQGRIVEAIYGRDQDLMEFQLSTDALRRSFADDPKLDQHLVPDLNGLDPDDGLSDVPYTKGDWFLRFLEARFGRAVFDPFIHSYFDHFAFQSITTPQFVDYLKANLLDKNPGKVSMDEVNEWLHGVGIPKTAPDLRAPRFKIVAANRDKWLAGRLDAKALNGKKYSTQEWQYFLDSLPSKLTLAQMQQLDAAYDLTHTGNAPIGFRWYLHAIRSNYTAAYTAMQAHMIRIGRRILIVPLYVELAKTPDGLVLARKIYAEAKPGYHPLTRASVEKALSDTKR